MTARKNAPTLAEPDVSDPADATDVPAPDETDDVTPLENAMSVAADASHRERLRAIPKAWAYPNPVLIGKLPKPMKKGSQQGKCNRKRDGGDAPDWQDHFCGGYHGLPAVHLDYMGHADVTLALVDVDPEWTLDLGWESSTGPIDAFAMTSPVEPTQLLCRMTVLGVTRPCVGTTATWKGENAIKELISDAIRNGALRFGIATGLWSKSERVEADVEPSASTAGPAAPVDDRPPWKWNALKAKALEMVQSNGLEPAKDIARVMWDLVVPVTHPEGDEFNPDEVNRYCADFAEWLAGEMSDGSAEDVPTNLDAVAEGTPVPFGDHPLDPAGEQLMDAGEALR